MRSVFFVALETFELAAVTFNDPIMYNNLRHTLEQQNARQIHRYNNLLESEIASYTRSDVSSDFILCKFRLSGLPVCEFDL